MKEGEKLGTVSAVESTFAFARIEERDSGVIIVTFSIESPVWEEDALPQSGNLVILSDIRGHRMRGNKQGWRANHARFLRPDETGD